MNEVYAGDVYVVTVSKDGNIEHWVAATTPKEALVAVQLHVGPAWNVKLTNRRLTSHEKEGLQLRPNDVRKIDRPLGATPLPHPKSGSGS